MPAPYCVFNFGPLSTGIFSMRAKSRRQKQNGADFAAWIHIENRFQTGRFQYLLVPLELETQLWWFWTQGKIAQVQLGTITRAFRDSRCSVESLEQMAIVKKVSKTAEVFFNMSSEMQCCACQIVAGKLRKQQAQGKPSIDPFTTFWDLGHGFRSFVVATCSDAEIRGRLWKTLPTKTWVWSIWGYRSQFYLIICRFKTKSGKISSGVWIGVYPWKKSDGKSQMKNARVDVTHLFLTVDLKEFALAQGETGALPVHNRPSSVPEKYWDQLRLWINCDWLWQKCKQGHLQ